MFFLKKFLILIFAFTFGNVAFAGDADFTVFNQTGYTINNLYVSPDNDNDWGKDILGKGYLNNRAKRLITFNKRSRQCVYDLKVIFEDGEEAEWQDFDLCTISKITLKYDHKNGTTTATYE
jgi:hypothetical protein